MVVHYVVTDRSDVLNYPYHVYVLGVLMAVILTIIPSFLVSLAIKKFAANNFSIIGIIGLISTITLAYIFLDERLSILQFIVVAIVISGVGYISLSKSKNV